jgi:hypothetical protein
VLGKVRELVLPAIERHGPIEAWIIDDTGFPKKGRHSVGVARQYCGQVGKQDNCQVAVSLSLANRHASLPVAWRLYLPKEWAADEERRRKAGVPEEVDFATKPQIALEQLREACAAGLPRGVVLMDPGYGHDGQLRAAVTALGLAYVARYSIEQHGVAIRQRAQARRQSADHGAPRRTRAGLGQGGGVGLAEQGLAPDQVAGRFRRLAVVALCAPARARRPSSPPARQLPTGVAADRMAEGREGADQVLALDLARTDRLPGWSISPSCAGASSATIRNSSRRSGSATMKGAAGVASIITPRCASPPTAS